MGGCLDTPQVVELLKSQKGQIYAPIPPIYTSVTAAFYDAEGKLLEKRVDKVRPGSRFKTLKKQNDPNWGRVRKIVYTSAGKPIRIVNFLEKPDSKGKVHDRTPDTEGGSGAIASDSAGGTGSKWIPVSKHTTYRVDAVKTVDSSMGAASPAATNQAFL